jgi:hypothetical protein
MRNVYFLTFPLSYFLLFKIAIISTISTYTIVLVSVIAIFCTILLFLFVRNQTKKSLRHNFTTGTSTPTAGNLEVRTKQDQRSKLVRTQSILYVLVNVNNSIWLFIFNRLVLNSINSENIHENDPIIFASGFMLFLFMPLYGFFNYCIYCYPRFKRIKEHFPEKSFFWCIRILYRKDEGESEIISRRRYNQIQKSRSDLSFSAISLTGIPPNTIPVEGEPHVCDMKIHLNDDEKQNDSANTLSMNGSGETLSLENDNNDDDMEDAIEHDSLNKSITIGIDGNDNDTDIIDNNKNNNNCSSKDTSGNCQNVVNIILQDENDRMMDIESSTNKLYIDY